MPNEIPDYAKDLARKLRIRQTPAEALLWMYLRGRRLSGYKFYRQYPIYRYIVDFCCPERKLVVELDGGGHTLEQIKGHDETRQEDLKSRGFYIIRFENEQIINDISLALKEINLVLTRNDIMKPIW